MPSSKNEVIKQKMKKKSTFIWKILLLFAPFLILWALLWLFPNVEMSRDYAMWDAQMDYITGNSDYNRVLFLGDSNIKWHLDMNLMPEECYCLGLGQSTPMEAYYTLVHYLEHHEAPETVMVQFTPTAYQSEWGCFLTQNVLFHYFEPDEYLEVYQISKDMGLHTFDGISMQEFLRYYLRMPDLLGPKFLKNLLNDNANYVKSVRNIVESNRGSFALREDPDAALNYVTHEHFQIDPLKKVYLQKLSDLCKEQGIQMILSAPVFSETDATVHHTESWWEDFHSAFAFLEEDCIVDKESMIYPDDHFVSHLNALGIETYTTDFREKWSYLWNE